jgi:DNA-binding GntR family transcriptional regulator
VLPPLKAEGTSKTLIYKELRRSIILGQCQPGEGLGMDVLAGSYEPMQCALQILSQTGLVTM